MVLDKHECVFRPLDVAEVWEVTEILAFPVTAALCAYAIDGVAWLRPFDVQTCRCEGFPFLAVGSLGFAVARAVELGGVQIRALGGTRFEVRLPDGKIEAHDSAKGDPGEVYQCGAPPTS